MESILISKEKRLSWLDSLRGVACVIVAVFHLWQHVKSAYVLQFNSTLFKYLSFFIDDFFDLGKIGVVTFFLISGYLVSFSIKNKTVHAFAVSRFFRLFPPYWLSIILFVIVNGLPSITLLVMNFTMFQKFFGITDLVGVYWTLQIELVFYFLCAFLVLFNLFSNQKFITKTFFLFLLLSLLISFARFYFEKKFPVALFLGLSVMFLGLLLKYYIVDKKIDLLKIRSYIVYFFLVLLLICLLAYNKDYGYNEKWYRYYVSYLSAFALFFLFEKYKFTNKYLLFFGSISYSMYLLHPILGLDLTKIILRKFNLMVLDNPIGFTFLYWTFTIIGSYLCYKYLEKKSISFGKKIF